MSTTTDPFAAFRQPILRNLPRLYLAAPSAAAVNSWCKSQNIDSNWAVPVVPGSLIGIWPVAHKDDVVVILPGCSNEHAESVIAASGDTVVDLRSVTEHVDGHAQCNETPTDAAALTEGQMRRFAAGELASAAASVRGRIESHEHERARLVRDIERVDASITHLELVARSSEVGAHALDPDAYPVNGTPAGD